MGDVVMLQPERRPAAAIWLGFAVVAVILSVPARADWQYTKWGMSSEDLYALEQGKILKTSPSEETGQSNPYIGRAKLKTSYKAGEIAYTAYFLFNNDKLAAVSLNPEEPRQSQRVKSQLESTHGVPISTVQLGHGITITKWRDLTKGDMVWFLSVGENYSIRYCPIISDTAGGF